MQSLKIATQIPDSLWKILYTLCSVNLICSFEASMQPEHRIMYIWNVVQKCDESLLGNSSVWWRLKNIPNHVKFHHKFHLGRESRITKCEKSYFAKLMGMNLWKPKFCWSRGCLYIYAFLYIVLLLFFWRDGVVYMNITN